MECGLLLKEKKIIMELNGSPFFLLSYQCQSYHLQDESKTWEDDILDEGSATKEVFPSLSVLEMVSWRRLIDIWLFLTVGSTPQNLSKCWLLRHP